MTVAILQAELPPPVGYGNTVPDKASLLAIACDPLGGLGIYTTGVHLGGHNVPDEAFIVGAVLAVGGPGAPPPVQQVVAEAAVAGAIACGFVNYYCRGSDITKAILEGPALQTQDVPIPFLQPPFKKPPNPNPCAAAGTHGTCWGDIIGWSKVTCTVPSSVLDGDGNGVCEHPDAGGNYPQLAVPGSAGFPHNSGAPEVCTTGTVIGLSIGYDGDVSFDLIGPNVLPLLNYHNFLPGPGGSEPPNGIDIEIPVDDRPLFLNTLAALRPGMNVHVCGRWVADMHMKWNELHPVTVLNIVPPNHPPSADAGAMQTLEATSSAGAAVNLSGSGTDPDNDPLTFSWTEGATPLGAGAQISVTLPIGVHTIILTANDGNGGTRTATVSITVQDTTPPTFTPPANQTLEATSPAGAVAVFSATATDIVDGTVPVICVPASGSTFALGTSTVNCTATDVHTNSTSRSFTINVRDTIAPKIACGIPDTAWHATDVSIACAASDSGSGLANSADAHFLLSTSVPNWTETAIAQTSSRSVCDAAGNCALAGPLAPIKVDKKGPGITITTPANGAAYVLNQSITVGYSCVDGGSGLSTCTGTIPSGSALVTSSVGSKSFTVNASDNVGNSSNKSVSYSISYNICLLYDPTMAKKSGSTYPIKIQLCDAAGQNVSAPAIIVHAVSVTMKSTSAPGVLDDSGNANPDLDFRYDSGGYMFNLKTTGNATGTYNLNFTAGTDPNTHSVPFEIK